MLPCHFSEKNNVKYKKIAIHSNEVEADPYNLRAPDFIASKKAPRWKALDIARGFAIFLMILSHCVKGLMIPSRIPDWGIVPVHLLTKFSSSLFILVFGVSISLYFLPKVGTLEWPKKRFWMIRRGFELLIWYKILTVVQMFQFYPRSMIIDTLMFRSMPDFVEILFFYAVALIWLPFFLPLWNKMGFILKSISIVGTFALGQWLHYNFNFWDLEILKATLVEHEDFYTFGQLQRGALVFFGLLIGDFYKSNKENKGPKHQVAIGCIFLGLIGLMSFYFRNSAKLMVELENVADNIGKHPFDLNFFCFSVGGAVFILGLSLLCNQLIQKVLIPVAYLGKHSLNAFILHIIIIFYFLRYYFDLHHEVTYMQSLQLTAATTVVIIFLLYCWNSFKRLLFK